MQSLHHVLPPNPVLPRVERLLVLVTIATLVAAALRASGAEPGDSGALRLCLELRDDIVVTGTPRFGKLTLESEMLGLAPVDLKLLMRIDIKPATREARFIFWGGDRLDGILLDDVIPMHTLFGEVNVPMKHVMTITVLGPLSEGVAYYPLDGDAVDMSGHRFHGRAHKITPATDRAGYPGGATRLDGNDSHIELPNEAFNDLPKGSIACWIRPDKLGGEILYKETFQRQTISGLRVNDNGTVHGSHDNFRGGADIVSTAALAPDEWHHVAWTWDGDMQRLYIDGALDATAASTDGVAADLAGWVRWGMGDSHFAGVIDEARIYERALTAEEVLNLAGRAGGPDNGARPTTDKETE